VRFVRLLCIFAALSPIAAGTAQADVIVLGVDGRTHHADDPGLLPAERVPAVRRPAARGGAGGRVATASRAPRRTVVRELRRMRDAGAIDAFEYSERREAYDSAKSLVKRLEGRRRIEMGAAVHLLDDMAAQGSLIVSRLEPLWRTLAVNRRWWTTGPLLVPGQRVRVDGAEMVWQYVPGQGLQFHPLANFGKLNALWRAKKRDAALERLLDELLPMAASRGGGLAWEYYFTFGGGRGPWVSGLAQGTALQSLARAAIRLQRKEEVLPIAARGLRIFELPPPTGVRVRAGDGGVHYLIYSFNPDLRILNGFVQALVGLFDFAAYANDDRARRLFAAGDRAARAEVPRYDTGFWSRYSLQRESDLSYHKLVIGFLENLCERTGTPVYCETGGNFGRYLFEAPVVGLETERVRAGTTAALRFRLSKVSSVRVSVTRGGRTVFLRTLYLGGGTHSVAWSVPRRSGDYEVAISATDPAANRGALVETVRALKARKRRR